MDVRLFFFILLVVVLHESVRILIRIYRNLELVTQACITNNCAVAYEVVGQPLAEKAAGTSVLVIYHKRATLW